MKKTLRDVTLIGTWSVKYQRPLGTFAGACWSFRRSTSQIPEMVAPTTVDAASLKGINQVTALAGI